MPVTSSTIRTPASLRSDRDRLGVGMSDRDQIGITDHLHRNQHYAPKPPEEVPSRETIHQMLNALDEPYQTLAWFVCTTGCRIGEALGLKWAAINFEDRYVWFLSAVYMGEEHKTKGHRSDRPVYLTQQDVERLRRFKSRVPSASEDDWVFPDPKHPGRPMTEQSALRCGLKKAGKKLGLNLTWHSLRHWSGTMLFYENVDVKTIQSRLGHADFRTTANWYIHANVEAARKAAQVASKCVNGGDSSPAVSPEIVRVTVRVNGGQEGQSMVSS